MNPSTDELIKDPLDEIFLNTPKEKAFFIEIGKLKEKLKITEHNRLHLIKRVEGYRKESFNFRHINAILDRIDERLFELEALGDKK